MLSSGHGALAGSLPGLLYHPPPARHLYDDDSSDEYGSCTEAPLYENVHDDDEEEDELGVYENVAFEPPAYSNLDGLSEQDEDGDGQVYANVPSREEAPTYDVPQRTTATHVPAAAAAAAAAPYQPQEYANLQASGQPAAGGLGVILEETESSSARSSSGSSGRGSSCTSAASSLARSTATSAPALRSTGLLARIRAGINGTQQQPVSSPLVIGLTPKEANKDVRSNNHSREPRLHDGGADGHRDNLRDNHRDHWSSRGSTPRTSFAKESQQATPERLARVQQQVRQHLNIDDQHQEPQPKLSVRDLLGHFEPQRQGAVRGATQGAGTRSYGFGSSTAKTALRKAVSQPPPANVYSNGNSATSSNNNNKNNNNNTTKISPATASYSSSTKSSHVNGNNINNKFASTAASSNNPSNSSRKSFLDSIIAGASDDRLKARSQGSRRSSATMEEVNNILNAVTAPPSDHAVNGGGRHHHVLRKAQSEGPVSPACPPSPSTPTSAATPATTSSTPERRNSNGSRAVVTKSHSQDAASPRDKGNRRSSSQEIPSIVDQLPDDDRPQESRRMTNQWDPSVLVNVLYSVPEPLRDKPRPVDRVNVEGFLERLPSGRTKATFWNAWKRCYFRAKDGFLYCYPGKHSDKPMDVTQLMGGQVETFESMVITAQDRNPATVPMIGIDDRMGHYLVVRAGSQQETDRWTLALKTHTVEDFCSTYVQPWPMPRVPALLRDSIVIDLGSRSVRAGILCTQPSLPQVFFPAVCATRRGLAATLGAGDKVYGPAALQPSVRANSTLSYPIRPSERINKHTVDLAAVAGLLRVVFQSLAVDPRDYGVVVSVPRTLDNATQSRLVAELFDRFGVRSVLLSHQSVLALYAYNAASGVVVDLGERTDVVPIMDGYIVEGGVSRVTYGGEDMVGHVRRFLLQRAPPFSMSTVAEALLPRLALERLCYVASDYRADLKRAQRDPTEVASSVSVSEYFTGDKEPAMECLTLDAGRFQAPEGLFHPQAWGLDNPGVHQMVHKAILECSMDARKTMARSIYLAGGLTMLPGFTDRLREELAALLPPAAAPKVHASPYRYHAAYLGACVLANSSGVREMCLSKEEYTRDGGKLLRPWIL